jgi:hypothetical protein
MLRTPKHQTAQSIVTLGLNPHVADEIRKKNGAIGGRKRAANLKTSKRYRIARQAARARWTKYRSQKRIEKARAARRAQREKGAEAPSTV